MPSSQVTAFLDLATKSIRPVERDAVQSEFASQFYEAADGVAFDLALWSLAARLRTDTEELLRLVGESWVRESGLVGELKGSDDASEALGRFLEQVAANGLQPVPIPGADAFELSVSESGVGRIKVSCNGPRRFCSFLEGAARAICALQNMSLRYQRFPKNATAATIVFSLVEA